MLVEESEPNTCMNVEGESECGYFRDFTRERLGSTRTVDGKKREAYKSFLYSKLWPWDLVPSHSSCCSAVRSWIYVAGGGVGGFAAITG